MDDFAALKSIRSKVDEKGRTIHNPEILKFLQDEKGFFSMSVCIGWELSIQCKFLEKHVEHYANLQTILRRVETLEKKHKTENQR